MFGPVIIDTNLLLLLVVGSADKKYINMHNRLTEYNSQDFDNLVTLIGEFSELILLPNTLTETSNFARQIKNPARLAILLKFRELVEVTYEISVDSRLSVTRSEFLDLGLTDSAILHLCATGIGDLSPTLLSVDDDLLNCAHSLGYGCIDYSELR